MGSLIDELERREAAARAEPEELRVRIAELAEHLAGNARRAAAGGADRRGGRAEHEQGRKMYLAGKCHR
jgi:hypothetical protein